MTSISTDVGQRKEMEKEYHANDFMSSEEVFLMDRSLRHSRGREIVCITGKRSQHASDRSLRLLPFLIGGICQVHSAVKGASRQMPHAGKITPLSNHSRFAQYSLSNHYSLISAIHKMFLNSNARFDFTSRLILQPGVEFNE